MLNNLFEKIETLFTIGIIVFAIIVVIVVAMKINEIHKEKEKEKEEKRKLAQDVKLFQECSKTWPSDTLYNYWNKIHKEIDYMKRSQDKPSPPYCFARMIEIFPNGKLQYISVTIETGYEMINILRKEMQKRGLKVPW